MLRCVLCGKYTLQEFCSCSGKTLSPKPAKWSPADKYSSYRIKYRKQQEEV
ncbi:ribosome biogenesis protein [Candidatus Woesearchaeota archaeon]|nr:ribosome biogenesis protein [Candidatus Woesearchaeota archaeon]